MGITCYRLYRKAVPATLLAWALGFAATGALNMIGMCPCGDAGPSAFIQTTLYGSPSGWIGPLDLLFADAILNGCAAALIVAVLALAGRPRHVAGNPSGTTDLVPLDA